MEIIRSKLLLKWGFDLPSTKIILLFDDIIFKAVNNIYL